MLTKREMALVLTTALLMCIPIAMIAHKSKKENVMTSMVFDWNSITAKKTKVGESRAFFDSPTKTLDQLECHVTTLNPGEFAHAAHQHAEEELTIVKEGTVEVLVNGVLKRVGPGSVIFQSSNLLHSIQNVGTITATYHVIKFRSAKTKEAGN